MKILFLLSRIEKSGVTVHTLDLAEGLVRQGHELHMITGGITDKTNEYLIKIHDRFKELGVEIKTFKTPKGNILRRGWISFFSICQILAMIRKVKADVIHSQSPYLTFLPWLLRKKFVTTVHNVQLIKNIKYKNPTSLIAISKESKNYAIDALGARPDSVSVVCHGISERYSGSTQENKKSELRAAYDIPENRMVLGYVGRITVEKGLDVMIDAIENFLPEELIAKLHLVFLGDYVQESDEIWLVDIMERSSLSKQISIVPFQDPKPFYDIFDIFILPSKSEAFGLVCIEAMMSGCLTIRTDTNGAEDQINHGEDGFIFENNNAQALAEILEQVLSNKDLRACVAKKGKEKALAHFTIDAMTSSTVEVYKQLVY